MEYAVIQTGGKQYKVNKGMVLEVERLVEEKDKEVIFDQVLLHVVDEKVNLGTPYIKNLAVVGKVLDQTKGDKIYVVKFRAKSRHRRKTGHRQYLSKVVIDEIKEIKEKAESKPKEKTVKSEK